MCFLHSSYSLQEDTCTIGFTIDYLLFVYLIHQNLKTKTSKPLSSNTLHKCWCFQNYNAKIHLAFKKPRHSDERKTLHLQNLDRWFKIQNASGKVQNWSFILRKTCILMVDTGGLLGWFSWSINHCQAKIQQLILLEDLSSPSKLNLAVTKHRACSQPSNIVTDVQ